MANISLKRLILEAEDFKAKSKETGKLVHFKSKDSYQAALKAGTHEDPKAKKGSSSKATKPNDMFGGDYAKDRGGETATTKVSHIPVQSDSQEVKTISKFTSTREKFIADFINKHKLDASALSKFIEKGSLRDRMDVGTAMVGNPGNKYEKDLIKKFGAKEAAPKTKGTGIANDNIDALTSHKDLDKFFKGNKDKLDKKYIDNIEDEIGALKYLESDYKRGKADREEVDVAALEIQDLIKKALVKNTPKSDMGVDSVVYNKRTNTVGIVRIADERGETKTDADGNVNTDELEPYNPMKYPHQKDAKVAPSTKKEVDSRGLYNPFASTKGGDSKEQPTSKPKEARKGNPTVNKEAKKNAETFGITPQKLGNGGYKKVMLQAAVEALTDANFHDEARELISKIEGKPEWANRVDYPSMDDPKYKEKMADIRTNGVDSSEYWRGDNNAHEFGRKVSSASGWDGVDAADGIAFTLRMNGFHKEADMIQSVFDDKPYMSEQTITKKTNENKMKHISLKALLEAEDFQARSKETGKLVHFKSKDAYQAALKAGSHEDPKAEKGGEPKGDVTPNNMFGGDYAKDRGDDGFGYGPENDRTPATSLPKKASQLNYKHAEVLEKALNAEAGLGGYVDTDDNTDAIMFTASSGMAPTYTLYFGGNDDYGKPDEFRVSLLSTYGNDPSNIGDSIDKSFKTAEEAMAFAKQVAKKYKKELEMDDDTNESTKLKSMFRK